MSNGTKLGPPLWSSIDTGTVNPYTCRTLVRIDALIYRLRGRRVRWMSGMLCERNGEARSHFPGSWFAMAAKVQNRWTWTHRLLSL